ncbi:hypothetical protein Gogos_006009 [Gossypium gossypioides]|uniref:Uncharacterized protein n=1 Tax=Gossypium gossypioides TaxID=34282 RepID=A0A7J9C505_GOSGO|nr:hypothetical protein [Gossypium gossypioides]
MVGLSIEDGEEEAWQFPSKSKYQKSMYEFCLVGCFLMASVVHFSTMQNTMANL